VRFTTERIIRTFAGAVVMASLGLGYFHSPYWYLLTAFAGLNLFQSGFTGFCPPEMLLDRVRGKRSAAGSQPAAGASRL
jgi:Inner membrane protein YgaP-like, transmembrane domain